MISRTKNIGFHDLYPFAAIRANRVPRFGDVELGRFDLNAATAEYLGRENIGVFVGGFARLESIMDRLDALAATEYPGVWVVVLSSKNVADMCWNKQRGDTAKRRASQMPRFWECGSVVYTTPEGLNAYARDREAETTVAGILIVDPLCHVHKARGYQVGGSIKHDRPQRVANFRADETRDGWAPPLLVLTTKPARSVNPDPMMSAYCLDAWQFVDGARLRVGKPPIAVAQPWP